MLTRLVTHNGDAYQITAILLEAGKLDIVEVIMLPLVGKPRTVFFSNLTEDLQERLINAIKQ